jgi:diguanylate cyclase (GGDEF)-like protein/PAS domain S-box-containing protein
MGEPLSLQDETEALLQFLYLAPVGLVQTTMDGEILMLNPLCAQLLLPLARDGELTNLFTALQGLAPDLALRARTFSGAHGKVCEGMLLPVTAGMPGQREAQVLSLTLLKLDNQRLMGVLDDVSLQLRRERELRQSQAWLQAVTPGMADYALMSLDAQGRVQAWNAGVGRLTGYRAADLVGRPFACLHPEDEGQRARAGERLRDADASGWSLEEGWLQRADGSRFWGSSLVTPLHDDPEGPAATRGYSLVVRDISDRHEAHEALRRSVSSDHLTGLANRRAFFEAAARELQRCGRTGQPASLVLIDADHFKAVNDTHGHAAGDAVLRHLAAGMSATFRAGDLLARIGGEEFAVLLPGATVDDAAAVAARLGDRLAAQAVVVDGRAIGCTVSAGVAGLATDAQDLDTLLARADAAMYAAKAQGRARVVRWHAGLTRAAEAQR